MIPLGRVLISPEDRCTKAGARPAGRTDRFSENARTKPRFDTLAGPQMWRENLSKASLKTCSECVAVEIQETTAAAWSLTSRPKLGIRVMCRNSRLHCIRLKPIIIARAMSRQQGTIFGLLIPFVALRVSTTSCDSRTMRA